MTGLYLKHPHSRLIYDGKKSIIAQPSPIPITGTHTLVSKESGVGLAYGLVTIAPPDTIDYDQFDSQFKLHRVTTKEREKWWSDSKSLLLYPITSFVPYATPLTVDVPAGVQMIMPEVKFIDADPDQDVKEVENEPEDDMPWTASDAQSHTKLANTPAKQKRWASVANAALKACDGDVKKCEASAIRQANSVIKEAKKKELERELIELGWMELVNQDEDTAEEVVTEEAECEFNPQEKSTDGAEVEVIPTQDSSPTGATTGADKESESETTATADEDDVGVVPEPEGRKSALAKFFQDSLLKLKDIIGPPDSTDATIAPNRIKSLSSKDGSKSYFIIWPTNSYYDREGEAFRADAFHDFLDRMDSSAVKSCAQFWHLKQTKFGDIIWQDVIEERFLMQVGEYDNTPVGNAFKSFFTKYPDGHPVIAPEGWGASHGYTYNAGDRQDGVYDWLHTDESTVLPLRYAANLLNPSPVLGGKEMDDKRRETLRALSEELGLDLIEYAETTGKLKRELADGKVEHKEMTNEDKETEKTETEDVSPDEKKDVTAESAAEVQDTPAAANVDAIVAAFVEQAGLKELSEAFAALQARMDKLETTDEKKIEEKVEEDTPRYPFSWLLVKSEDESTVLTPDEEKEFEDKKPGGVGNSEIGNLLTGLHRQS